MKRYSTYCQRHKVFRCDGPYKKVLSWYFSFVKNDHDFDRLMDQEPPDVNDGVASSLEAHGQISPVTATAGSRPFSANDVEVGSVASL